MPTELRGKLETHLAIHSAKAAYVPEDMCGDGEAGRDKDGRALCGSLLISPILLLSKKFSSIEEDRHAVTVECSHNVGLKSKSYCPENKPWGKYDRLSKSLRK